VGVVTNSDGILIARTDYREQYDRDLSIAPLVANALSGDQTSGAWLDDVHGTMSWRSVRRCAIAPPPPPLVRSSRLPDRRLARRRHQASDHLGRRLLRARHAEQAVVVGST